MKKHNCKFVKLIRAAELLPSFLRHTRVDNSLTNVDNRKQNSNVRYNCVVDRWNFLNPNRNHNSHVDKQIYRIHYDRFVSNRIDSVSHHIFYDIGPNVPNRGNRMRNNNERYNCIVVD